LTSRTRWWIAALLVAVLCAATWLSWSSPADSELLRVAAPAVVERHPEMQFDERVTQTGRFGTYLLRFSGRDEIGEITAVARVRVAATGPELLSLDWYYGSRRSLPLYLLYVIALSALGYLLFFKSVPRAFGRKCPRHGCLLESTDTVVQPQTWDPKGLSRPCIIERTYACPECDFRHVEAFPDPHYRPVATLETPVYQYQWQTAAAEKMHKRRMETAITDEEYKELLAQAKKRALEKTSRDSLWREF